jgi:hypothetical protein
MIDKFSTFQSVCIRTPKRFLAGISFVALATLAAPVLAQDVDGTQITFEQIFEHPDDQALNLRYARQQAKEGDLISAAAALERMLYTQPNWDAARLFYAMVLYRLDDQRAAIRELDLLEDRPLSAAQRTQLDTYRNNFSNSEDEEASHSTEFSGRFALGIRYDDNAGNALSDTFLPTTNLDDISVFAQLALRFSAPLSSDGNTRFRLGFDGQSRRHETFSRVDYDSFGGHVGLSGTFEDFAWFSNLDVRQVNISGDKYLTEIGPRMTVRKSVAEQTYIYLSGTFYDQNYHEIANSFGQKSRSGDKWTLGAGFRHVVSPKMLVGAEIVYEDKEATNPNFGYTGWRLNGDFRASYKNGTYLVGYASYRNLNYGSGLFGGLTPPQRDDDHLYGRLALGVSLAKLASMSGGENSKLWESMHLEGAVNYRNRDSSIAAFDYDNFGAELKLIWDF